MRARVWSPVRFATRSRALRVAGIEAMDLISTHAKYKVISIVQFQARTMYADLAASQVVPQVVSKQFQASLRLELLL